MTRPCQCWRLTRRPIVSSAPSRTFAWLRALAPGDRTALIAFAGRSYILTPLTIDDGAIALFLDDLDPSVVGQPGTSLSRAIRQGTDLLLATPTAADRALIIMSDGEGFDGEADVRAAAAHAGEEGISLITVGYGTERGSTIPLQSGGATTVKRDATGEVVVTHYMPDLLAAAAEAAHGTFIPATTTDKAANIRRALNTLRVAQRAVEQGEDRSARFQIFLGIALVLLIIDTLLADSRRPVGRARSSAAPGTARTPVLIGARAGAIGVVILVAPGLGSGTAPSHARDQSRRPPAFAAAMQDQGAGGPAPASQAAAMRRAIGAGDRTPRTLYNYGTDAAGVGFRRRRRRGALPRHGCARSGRAIPGVVQSGSRAFASRTGVRGRQRGVGARCRARRVQTHSPRPPHRRGRTMELRVGASAKEGRRRRRWRRCWRRRRIERRAVQDTAAPTAEWWCGCIGTPPGRRAAE